VPQLPNFLSNLMAIARFFAGTATDQKEKTDHVVGDLIDNI
jgi:hypothetical protein